MGYDGRVVLDAESLPQHIRANLESFRSVRYRSEEQAVALDSFAPEERATIRAIYDFLSALHRVLEEPSALDSCEALVAFTRDHDPSALIHAARRLGRDGASEHVSAALHDIRGGALTALFVQLARASSEVGIGERTRAIAVAARDHMKIVRNVVLDVDPPARQRDLAEIPHSLAELATALGGFTAKVGDREIFTAVRSEGEAAVIAERCVECAAVDRAAYNLLNNAAVHTTGSVVDVWLTPRDGNLCVAVANAVSQAQATLLEETLAGDSTTLFGNFTTTGSGHGLRIVCDLVARAYGITTVERLAKSGYVGAKVVDDVFLGWFHWPLAEVR